MNAEELKAAVNLSLNAAVKSGLNPELAIQSVILAAVNTALQAGASSFIVAGILSNVEHGVHRSAYRLSEEQQSKIIPANPGQLPPNMRGGRG